jgi:hypothetical protein
MPCETSNESGDSITEKTQMRSGMEGLFFSFPKSYLVICLLAFFFVGNSRPFTRQRRGGYQPGATPLELILPTSSALKGRRFLAPFQGASIYPETQGVALG